MNTYSKNRTICLIAIVVCAVIWAFLPFMSVNRATLDDQPPAIQYIFGHVTVVGDIHKSAPYLSSMAALISIICCFISLLLDWMTLARIAAIFPLIPMLYSIYHFYNWLGSDYSNIIIHAFGIGYWLMLIAFIVVIAYAKKEAQTMKATETVDAQDIEKK